MILLMVINGSINISGKYITHDNLMIHGMKKKMLDNNIFPQKIDSRLSYQFIIFI